MLQEPQKLIFAGSSPYTEVEAYLPPSLLSLDNGHRGYHRNKYGKSCNYARSEQMTLYAACLRPGFC